MAMLNNSLMLMTLLLAMTASGHTQTLVTHPAEQQILIGVIDFYGYA